MAETLQSPDDSSAMSEQVVPVANARGSTVAFLLDCIVTAERRKNEGTYPVELGAAHWGLLPTDTGLVVGGEDEGTDSEASEDEEERENGTQEAKHDQQPAPDPAKVIPEPLSGWPTGRGKRNRAKAAEFARIPRVPPAREPDQDMDASAEGLTHLELASDDGMGGSDASETIYESALSEISTPTATAMPQTPIPTFRELLEAMQLFELRNLEHVVFDALKAAHSEPGFDSRLPAEYVYAFSCHYAVGNQSYWATRCLASAWVSSGGPAQILGENALGGRIRPRVQFASLAEEAISLLHPEDRQSLEDMFRRFNRAMNSFSDALLQRRAPEEKVFGRKCKNACPEKDRFHGDFIAFKTHMLNYHVIPLLIGDPQFVRRAAFLDKNLRQHVGCTRCADRLIQDVLRHWKKIGRRAWCLHMRALPKKKHRYYVKAAKKAKKHRKKKGPFAWPPGLLAGGVHIAGEVPVAGGGAALGSLDGGLFAGAGAAPIAAGVMPIAGGVATPVAEAAAPIAGGGGWSPPGGGSWLSPAPGGDGWGQATDDWEPTAGPAPIAGWSSPAQTEDWPTAQGGQPLEPSQDGWDGW